MKILFASSAEIGSTVLKDFQEQLSAQHQIVGLITSPDKISGRGRELRPNPFLQSLGSTMLPIFKPKTHEELNQCLTEIAPDLVVTVAYGRLIKSRELSLPKYGWLNLHFSLLPRWRGAAPVQYAIWNGDPETGVTVFKLDEGLDTGAIYSQRSLKIEDSDTTVNLLEKLAKMGVPALIDAVSMVEAGLSPAAQPQTLSTLAPKIAKQSGEIDWNQSAEYLDRQIRAFTYWPGTWSYFRGTKLAIVSAKRSPLNLEKLTPGQIAVDEKILVCCGQGALELIRVKAEGKKEMSAQEWIRGVQNRESLRFEPLVDKV